LKIVIHPPVHIVKINGTLFMLSNLKNFFLKDSQEPKQPAGQSIVNLDQSPYFITDPDQIIILLKEIENSSPMCSVIFEGIQQEFNTSILDIQESKQQIILDELIPKVGNQFLLKKNKLKLSTYHNGIRLAFMLTNISPYSSKGIAYYKVAIPDRIYYPQRRSAARIPLSSINISFTGVSQKSQLTLNGYLFDISRSGIGILIPNNKIRITRGEIIKNCRITFDDNTATFNMMTRFVKTGTMRRDPIQIGGCFHDMDIKAQKKLGMFVSSIEREEIRRRKEE
jgi:c-di-GMP-binding flagellar brake protein YcgR